LPLCHKSFQATFSHAGFSVDDGEMRLPVRSGRSIVRPKPATRVGIGNDQANVRLRLRIQLMDATQ